MRNPIVAAVTVLTILVVAAPALAAPPANDNFSGRVDMSTGGPTFSGTTAEATTETNENASGGQGKTVWYQFVPPSNGTYSFSTCGSNTDTILGAYTGLAFPLTQVVLNDEA